MVNVNLAELLALVLPCGFVEGGVAGLPVGLQMIGAAFDETLRLSSSDLLLSIRPFYFSTMANVGGSSSGAARVPKAPERREGRWGPSQLGNHFRLPSANEMPYTDGVKGEMCFFEAPLKSGIVPNAWRVLMGCAVMWPMYLGLECQLSLKEFLWFYTPIRSTQVDRFWYFRPRNQGVSPITSYPDTNKGWHDCYFLCLVLDGNVFLARIVKYRRDIKGLTSSEQAHVDAILEVGSIDWNALVCRENEGWLGYTVSEPSPRANPSPRSERSPRGRFPREDSRKESSHVSVGGTKRKNSQEVEGSFHGHSLKKRRASPPLGVSEAEEEEAEEAPLARMSSKRAASIGLEDVSPMLSPTSGVRTEIPVPAVKVIREIGTPSFSISLTAPPGQGEFPSSSRISNLPGILISERSEADEGDRPLAPAGFQHAVLLSDSASSGGLDLPEAAGGVEAEGKEPVTRPSSSGDDEESDSEPSALPSWRSRPYAQPLLNEEMMEDALRAPRHAKIDRLTRSLSHCVSLVAALDAAELKHDEELESSRLKLRKLEGDLESQRKLVEELRTVARGTHLQMQTYEARVMDLERDIASRDTEVAELRQTVMGLSRGV
ncbi:Glutamyl-tRNA(Gln) amidotransferase subunit A, chloroplastic/mitochondrial [Morella rubra]|uniref:Glutamyl-tRNA(Gln) amidotransferase subunit A, chloroplastic/mitochondrial n=1 Tax=Morella rubra TaxID=262757 RepID=A0A6A1WJF0_9ROSI|nr:Glutamyl-tRNA(Gln) amidotransferase subunit A, chloroplastic/mitochondrial [Morella rubra]